MYAKCERRITLKKKTYAPPHSPATYYKNPIYLHTSISTQQVVNHLKNKVSDNTYNNIINLYNTTLKDIDIIQL